jgi:hypothetical protein
MIISKRVDQDTFVSYRVAPPVEQTTWGQLFYPVPIIAMAFVIFMGVLRVIALMVVELAKALVKLLVTR